MDVEQKFKEIVEDIFRVDIKKLKGTTKFIEDLNAKSIDIIALIAATENQFGIKTNAYSVGESDETFLALYSTTLSIGTSSYFFTSSAA